MARRIAVFALVILTAVLLQTTVFGQISLFGVSPDLVLVVVISFALVEGPAVGASVGFSGGLLKDLLLEGPKGLTGLAYLIAGYIIGIMRPYVTSTSVLVPVAGIFVGTIIGSTLYAVMAVLLGQKVDPMGRSVMIILLTATYNMLLTPFVYPIVTRVAMAHPTEKVYRW